MKSFIVSLLFNNCITMTLIQNEIISKFAGLSLKEDMIDVLQTLVASYYQRSTKKLL